MSKPSEAEINETLGLPAPERAAPTSRAGETAKKVSDLDDAVDGLVERHRIAGESHAAAADRLMRETPLYERHKKAKAQILKSAGFEAATGGV